jgi:RHS repeat-associated protein
MLEGPQASVKYQYNKADQLLKAGTERFKYDANGNLIERKDPKGVTKYAYDNEDRLVKVTLPDNSRVRFGYSPTGERIWREDKNKRTWFVTDGQNLLTELDKDLNETASFLHGPGMDRPLMMWRQGSSYHYHAGLLGTVQGLTDKAGALIATYDTDAFGNLKSKKGQVANPFIYTGRYLEPSLGLYYYRARYYDPSLGRFLSEDPVWEPLDDPEGMNRYTYVRNTPTRFSDPMGLTPLEDVIRVFQQGDLDASSLDKAYGLPPRQPGVRVYNIRVPGHRKLVNIGSQDTTSVEGLRVVKSARTPESTWQMLREGRKLRTSDGRIFKSHVKPLRISQSADSTVKVRLPHKPVDTRARNLRALKQGRKIGKVGGPRVHKSDARPLRVDRHADITQKIKVQPGGPRTQGPLTTGKSSVQKQDLIERLSPDLDRPLTSHEMAGMSVLGLLVFYERWQNCTMVRKKSSYDCAIEMGQGMAFGAVVGAGAVALFGAPAVLTAGLALTAVTYASSVPELIEEGQKWEKACEDEIYAHKQRNQWLKNHVKPAQKSLAAACDNMAREMDPIMAAAEAACKKAQTAAGRADQLGREAENLVPVIKKESLSKLDAAMAACEKISKIREEIEGIGASAKKRADAVRAQLIRADGLASQCTQESQAADIQKSYAECQGLAESITKDADRVKAKAAEAEKIGAETGRVRSELTAAVKNSRAIRDKADQSVRLRIEFQKAVADFTDLQSQLPAKRASWIKKINGVMQSFPEQKVMRSRDSEFKSRYQAMLAQGEAARQKAQSYIPTCELDGARKRLEAGIEMAVNAKLDAEANINAEIRSYESALSDCNATSLEQSIKSALDAHHAASQLMAQHADLPQRAAECRQRLAEAGGSKSSVPGKPRKGVIEGTDYGGEGSEIPKKSGFKIVDEVSSGTDDTVYCPEDPEERKRMCDQICGAGGPIKTFEAQGSSAKWSQRVQRAYLFKAQCCGGRWTTEGFSEKGQEAEWPEDSQERRKQEALRNLRQVQEKLPERQKFLKKQKMEAERQKKEAAEMRRRLEPGTGQTGTGGMPVPDRLMEVDPGDTS